MVVHVVLYWFLIVSGGLVSLVRYIYNPGGLFGVSDVLILFNLIYGS